MRLRIFCGGLRRWLLVILGIIIFSASAQAAYLSINAGAENNQVGIGGGKVYNQNGIGAGNELALNCVLQYIYAGPNGTIDTPNQDGSVGGDDVLVATKSVGNDTVWATFSNQAGMFYHGVTGTYTSGSPKIYVRAWNAGTIATATHYGNSALVDPATNASNPPLPNDVGIANFYTNTTKPVAGPNITVNPTSASFSATQGSNPSPNTRSVTISNTGTVALTSWTAGAVTYTGGQTGWISLSKSNGGPISAGGSDSFTITVGTVTGFSAGTYTAMIPLTFSQGVASQNVIVTLIINPPGALALTSATPSSGDQGETLASVTIFGQNTHFSGASTVEFGAGIVHGVVTFDSAHPDQLTVANVVIASTAATGLRTVTVTTGAETATGQIFTVNSGGATTVVIDDYEGVAGNSSDSCSSYYVFAPSASANPAATRVTTDKHEGIYAMNTTYPAIADPLNAWRGWGGVLVSSKDLSGTDTLSFWLKGDGSANKVKFQVKDADGTNFAIQDADATTLSSVSWQEYRISDFKTKMARVGTTGDATLNWASIIEYQFVFSGASASTGVLIDYVSASTGGGGVTPHITGITPISGGERTIVTITGSNFQASGGTINFAGGGVTTAVRSTDTGSLITSWADGQIVLSLPRMAAGTKTISLVRTDGVSSDNSITFEVTAATNEGSTSYNYKNPFNPLGGETTNIVFSPGSAGNVSVYIFDMTARQIAKLDWTSSAPSASVEWNGKNNYGEIVGDGVYLYRIVDAGAGKMISKGKILVINK